MTKYLSNAFSLQMIPEDCVVSIRAVDAEKIPADVVSCIGHEDTAAVVSNILGRAVEFNRVSIKLDFDDELYVAQIVGGRLPEGATTIPEGMNIEFRRISLGRHCDGCNAIDCNSCAGITPLFY